ncbi:MAG: DUF1254 domain-containing protein [Terracidiphilus sp.]
MRRRLERLSVLTVWKAPSRLYKRGVLGKLSRREALRIAAGATVARTLNLSAWAGETRESARWPGPAETRATAREAYVYAFPIVQSYRTIYALALDRDGKQYQGPPNEVHSAARVLTPADTATVLPNLDMQTSFLMLDLRAEPLVVTLPTIEKNRYYSLHLMDLYGNDVDHAGTREDGNRGGNFLIAGPGWREEKPAGIRRVLPVATELGFATFRTQLFNEADLDKVREIQAGYTAQPLSEFLRKTAPEAPPEIVYPSMRGEMSGGEAAAGPEFWKRANFLLQFCPAGPAEAELRVQFERIGVKAGAPWPPRGMPQDAARAVEEAGRQAHEDLEAAAAKLKTKAGWPGATEEGMGRYWERALGAMAGGYGTPRVEELDCLCRQDGFGEPLDATKVNYTLTFAQGKLPPVKAFWSLTMYDAKSRLLVDNALNRYVINSAMLPVLKKNAEGGITLYLRHDSPGEGRESNWLPAPNGAMDVVLRMYLPEEAALDGEWAAPMLEKESDREEQKERKPLHPATHTRVHEAEEGVGAFVKARASCRSCG